MSNNPRFPEARPSEVGPHDVNEEQNDPKARLRKPEQDYANETGGQAAAVGPRGASEGARRVTERDAGRG